MSELQPDLTLERARRRSSARPPRPAADNVVIIGIAARNGHPISFWHFTRYGVVVALVTIAVAWVYLWLRYFAFG